MIKKLFCWLGWHNWKVYENTNGGPDHGHVNWLFTYNTGMIACKWCHRHKINYVCRIDYKEKKP